MSKSIKIEMGGEEEIEFSASVSTDGDVEDLYVGVIIRGAAIAIENLLNSKQRSYFEEMILEEVSAREEYAVDHAKEMKFQTMRDDRLTK